MIRIPIITFFLIVSSLVSHAQDETASFSGALEVAERYYEEKSYQLAHDQYQQIWEGWNAGKYETQTLEPGMDTYLQFRIHDSGWRAVAGRRNAGPQIQQAIESLTALLESLRPEKGVRYPDLFPDIALSLGDLYLEAQAYTNWSQAWRFYQQALDAWAGSTELEEAAEHYRTAVKRITRAYVREGDQNYLNMTRYLTLQVINDFLTLAETEEDKAFGNLLFALSLTRQGYDPRQRLRISQAFQNAVRWGAEADSPWLDDALYHYARWSEREGSLYFDDDGNLISEPNFAQAVEHYQMLVQRFNRRNSQYVDDAEKALTSIQDAVLGVVVPHVYLPESEVAFRVRSRNLDAITVEIYSVNLNQDLEASSLEQFKSGWAEAVQVRQMEPWKRYTLTPDPDQEYGYWSDEIRVDVIPEPGAYLVVAKSGEEKAVDLLLVTPTALVMKSTLSQSLVYMADALTGAPVPGAEVIVHRELRKNSNSEWEVQRGFTDSSGLVQFEFEPSSNWSSTLITAKQGTSQALGFYPGQYTRALGKEGVAYAYADRSLYRPGDTVNWKVVIRDRSNGRLSVPDGTEVDYTILDPRGNPIESGSVQLNNLGSGWGQLQLAEGDSSPLGIYTITFTSAEQTLDPAYNQLFRVEEVELPEFEVAIETRGPGETQKTFFQLGDPVHVAIQVDYLSGGAVVGAEAEVLVYEEPFHRMEPLPYGGRERSIASDMGPSRVISRNTYRTDSEGSIRFSLPEPTLMNQDLEYTVEARVRDATGSEVVSSKSIRMTRQPYFVSIQPEYQVYKPGDTVTVRVSTQDGNDQPVEVSGKLELVRLIWEEIWIDPRGNRISGHEYNSLRSKRGLFGLGTSTHDYRLLRRGYQVEKLDTVELKTDSSGEASYAYTLRKEGFYRVQWVSRDRNQIPIKSEARFFAADSASHDIGYHHGGLAIIFDQGRFEPGQSGPVMITSPVANRWVLLTEGEQTLTSARVLKMNGTIKLLNMEFSEDQVPGTFLEATMVDGLQSYQVRQRVEVPPIRHALEVDVQSQSTSYLPGEKAAWNIWVTDADGKPVSTELSLSVVDNAGFQIQPDFATDPLDFFYGAEPGFGIRTHSTFGWKGYIDNKPVDDATVSAPPSAPGSGSRPDGFEQVQEEMEKSYSQQLESAPGYMRGADDSAESMMPSLPAAVMEATMNRSVGGDAPQPRHRTQFEPALYWNPDIKTDVNGHALIEVPFSDSLTTWRATARAVAEGNRFGQATGFAQTRLPLIARLPLPDFLINGDTWEVNGVIQNNADHDLDFEATLDVEGAEFLESGRSPTVASRVEAGRQKRVSWKLQANQTGEALFQFSVRTDEYGDRLEKSIPVQEHGFTRKISKAGMISGGKSEVLFTVPVERRSESTRAEVVITPSLAAFLLDGYEFLAQDADKTSEVLASQLLTALHFNSVFKKQGYDLNALYRRSPSPDFEAGQKDAQSAWEAWILELQSNLKAMQHSNGGYSWHPNGGVDRYMTAYVVWALTRAEKEGLIRDMGPLDKGRNYLLDEIQETEFNFHEQVWLLHALASRFSGQAGGRPTRVETRAFSNLWKSRDSIDSFGTALLALTARYYGLIQEEAILVRNLRNGVETMTAGDGQPFVAWSPRRRSLRFAQSRPETTGMVVAALARLDPESELLEPAHRWLLRSRQAAAWRNTRETAFALYGLMEYHGTEDRSSVEGRLAVSWNGSNLGSLSLQGAPSPLEPLHLTVGSNSIQDGENRLAFEGTHNSARIYYRATVEYFSTEEPIPSTGDVLQVNRSYEHLKPQSTLLKGVVEERLPIQGESYLIGAGERIESILRLEADRPYPYLILEDQLPAGFESARLLSGGGVSAVRVLEEDLEDQDSTEQNVPVYVEIREGKAVFYIDGLSEGTWEIRYALRAETPGRFHALPALIRSKYLPEVQGNSTEILLQVVRQKED